MQVRMVQVRPGCVTGVTVAADIDIEEFVDGFEA
jgi:hypothetical protein